MEATPNTASHRLPCRQTKKFLAQHIPPVTGCLAMNEIPQEDAAMSYDPEQDNNDVAATPVQRIKEKNEFRLLRMEGVTGVGVGLDPIGNERIVVYLQNASFKAGIPGQIEGVDVATEVTGEIDAL